MVTKSQILTRHQYSNRVNLLLSLPIAKANYQFLRQAIKDQAGICAGPGWVAVVLDQRETDLRDVALSVVSESISTSFRLYDLGDSRGSDSALRKVCRRLSIETIVQPLASRSCRPPRGTTNRTHGSSQRIFSPLRRLISISTDSTTTPTSDLHLLVVFRVVVWEHHVSYFRHSSWKVLLTGAS